VFKFQLTVRTRSNIGFLSGIIQPFFLNMCVNRLLKIVESQHLSYAPPAMHNAS